MAARNKQSKGERSGGSAAPSRLRSRDDGAPSAGSPAARILATNLRALRVRSSLTLAELAGRAGVGKSTLAQLESGKANPSIDTLFALAVALDVPLTHLLSAPTPEVRLVRRGEGKRLASSDNSFEIFLLGSTGRHGTSEIFVLELEQGAARHSEPHARGAIEHVLVNSGRLRTGPIADPVEAGAGDLVTFDADVPHLYEALDPDTGAVVILDYPT